MNKQVLTIRHDVARVQRHNSRSKCLLSSSTIKISSFSFTFCSRIYLRIWILWIWILWSFYLIRARTELLCDPDSLRELSLHLSKKNRAVLAVCVIVTLLVDLMNDQVFFSTKKGHRSKFASAVSPCWKQSSIDEFFWEQRFYSLPFVATSILNVI